MDERLRNLREAISKCEGVPIPYNLIKNSIIPLKDWLDEIQKEGMNDERL